MKKIMSTAICVLLVLATVLCFSGCGEIVTSNYGDELVKNGSFEDGITSWESVLTGANYTAEIRTRGEGTDEADKLGVKYLSLHNAKSGYSYVKQAISVEPGATYKVSAEICLPSAVSSSNSSSAYEGAFLGFEENIDFLAVSSKKTSTSGWTYTYSFYFTTDRSEVTLCARLGLEDKICSGTAYFDNVSMVKVDPATLSSSVKVEELGVYVPDNGGVPGILYLVLGAVLVAVIAYFAYVLIRRHGYLNPTSDGEKVSAFGNLIKKNGAIIVVVAIAVVLRLVLGFLYTGYKTDMDVWASAASRLTAVGITEYYSAGAEIMPLYLYVLWGLGSIMKLFGLSGSGLYLLFKLPAIICDVITIIFLYKLGKKFIGHVGGVLVGALYAVIPTVLTATSVWGEIDSLFAMLALLTLYFILNPNGMKDGKRYVGVYVCLVAGVLTKIEMLWLVPVISAFLIYNFIKKKESRKALLIGGIASIFAFYLVSLPFFINYVAAGKIFYVWEYYFAVLGKGALYYSMDKFGLFGLVGRNWILVNSAAKIANLVFGLLLIALGVFIYLNNKSRVELLLVSALTLLGAGVFAIEMSPTMTITGFTLLLAYAVISNEKRVYWMSMVFALIGFLNAAVVLNMSGTLTPFVPGSIVKFASGDAFMIIMSIVEILAVVGVGYLTYDICFDNKIKQIDYLESRAHK